MSRFAVLDQRTAPLLTGFSCIVLAVLGGLSCSAPEAPPASPEPMAEPPAASVHVAFAGGGWRAHTAHAAWTMSLLDDGARSLDEVFSNVASISSNSGGTWFSTMLAFSHAFATAIEAENAIPTYPTSAGYLGMQQALIDPASEVELDIDWCDPFEDTFPYIYFYCRLATLAGSEGVVWSDIVSKIVFEPFGMNQELAGTLLGGQRQKWADGKSLLMAATLLTDHAVLNENDFFDKLYYDATVDSGPAQVNLSPLTFSSTPGAQVPPFLAAGGFELAYANNGDSNPVEPIAEIDNPLPSDGVPVLTATASSSAALGAAASYTVLEQNGFSWASWQAAYELSDLALPFSLATPIESRSPSGLTVDQLAESIFARVADGGYLDNSAVAQLVSFLQLNEKADGFQIVAFDNVQNVYQPTGGSGAAIGIDLAPLFGKGLGGPNHDELCVDGFCVKVPAQQIFATEALNSTEATWTYSPEKRAVLIYTRYQVTTIDNPTLDVAAGTTGTLHAFTCSWPTAPTAPVDGVSDFTAYGAMLNGIYDGLTANDGEGLGYLRAALSGS